MNILTVFPSLFLWVGPAWTWWHHQLLMWVKEESRETLTQSACAPPPGWVKLPLDPTTLCLLPWAGWVSLDAESPCKQRVLHPRAVVGLSAEQMARPRAGELLPELMSSTWRLPRPHLKVSLSPGNPGAGGYGGAWGPGKFCAPGQQSLPHRGPAWTAESWTALPCGASLLRSLPQSMDVGWRHVQNASVRSPALQGPVLRLPSAAGGWAPSSQGAPSCPWYRSSPAGHGTLCFGGVWPQPRQRSRRPALCSLLLGGGWFSLLTGAFAEQTWQSPGSLIQFSLIAEPLPCCSN